MSGDELANALPCPIANAHRRLMDCHDLWHATERQYMEPESFRLNLNSLIQSLRNVTWILQKNKADLPDFSGWYKIWQDSARQDPIMQWIVRSRNRIVKESDLELLSRASIRVSIDWTHEFSMSWTMPPRYTTRDILIRLLSTQKIPQAGILTIERRWIDRLLPDFELLDACAHSYRRTAQIIATAHTKAQVTHCNLPVRSTPCVTSELLGQLQCMHEREESRRLHINLETRAEVSEYVEILPSDPIAARDRYGELQLTGDAIARVPQLIEVNKRMLQMDGALATVAILMRGDRTVDTYGLDFYDQASKRLAVHNIAEWADRSDADGVIFVTESWIAYLSADEDPTDPRTPPARDRPDKMEAINVIAITKDGRTADATCMFSRGQDGTMVFGEVIHDVGGQVNVLEPIRQRWQRLP